MAVRFNAAAGSSSGDRLLLNTGLTAQTNYTITFWFKLTQSYNGNFATFFSLGPTSDNGTNANVIQVDPDGILVLWSDFGSSFSDLVPTVGTWYFIGCIFDGLNCYYRIKEEGAGSFIVGDIFAQGSHPNAQLRLGNSHFASEPVNGCIEALKWWSVSLTTTELEAEATQRLPVRTSNIRYYWKFTDSATTDNSGNGGNLTMRGTVTLESGPASLVDEVSSETPIDVGDSGSSAESLSVTRTLVISDTASSDQSLTASASVVVSDSSESEQSLVVSTAAQFNDSANSIEALAASVEAVLGESATSTDLVSTSTSLVVGDFAESEDSLGITAVIELEEEGSSEEFLTLTRPVGISESGSSEESLSLVVESALSDSATVLELLNANVELSVDEQGSSEESVTTDETRVLPDSGTSDQDLSVLAVFDLEDSATGSDQLTTLVEIELTDSASASESFIQGAIKPLGDSGTATEALAVSVALSLTQDASSLESLVLSESVLVGVSDSGSGVELFIGQTPYTPGVLKPVFPNRPDLSPNLVSRSDVEVNPVGRTLIHSQSRTDVGAKNRPVTAPKMGSRDVR